MTKTTFTCGCYVTNPPREFVLCSIHARLPPNLARLLRENGMAPEVFRLAVKTVEIIKEKK